MYLTMTDAELRLLPLRALVMPVNPTRLNRRSQTLLVR